MCVDLNQQQALNLYICTCIITPLSGLHYSTLQQRKKVEDIGVEPMTPCVQGRCSSQLS
jgi:hypothetical protein